MQVNDPIYLLCYDLCRFYVVDTNTCKILRVRSGFGGNIFCITLDPIVFTFSFAYFNVHYYQSGAYSVLTVIHVLITVVL